MRHLVIAVDGPSGSGKSSAARGVAVLLGLGYLDTGAMYRAMTWWMLEHGIDLADPAAIAAQADRPVIDVGTDPRGRHVGADGTDVTAAIRTRRVSNAVSAVAAVPRVRELLIARQREIIDKAAESGSGIVAEGRDIGRVVAPAAPLKIFLTASEQARAERRSAELAADPSVTAEVTRLEQARRDTRDAPQTERAADAVEIDATTIGLDEVIARIASLATSRMAGTRAGDVAWTS